MKTLMKISISLCLMLLTCATSYAQSAELADKYWDAAQALAEQGKYLEAAQMYAKSAQAETESPRPRLKDLGVELNEAGYYYQKVGQYDQSLKYLEQALAIDRKLGREGSIAT